MQVDYFLCCYDQMSDTNNLRTFRRVHSIMTEKAWQPELSGSQYQPGGEERGMPGHSWFCPFSFLFSLEP